MKAKQEESTVALLEKPPEPGFGHWTPVADALPARAKHVLFTIHGRDVRMGVYVGGRLDQWRTDAGHYYESGNQVTHWMPAPPAP